MLLLHTFDRLDLFSKNSALGRIPEKKDFAGNLIDVLTPGAAAASDRESDFLNGDLNTGTDEKGRFFTYFDDDLIRELVQDDPRYEMLRLWRTRDNLGRETKWINMLVRNLG